MCRGICQDAHELVRTFPAGTDDDGHVAQCQGTAAAYRKVYKREIRYRSMKKTVLFCKIGRIRLQQENKGSDMPYLCIVFGKQENEPEFADSPSRHVHTPGTRTCRLRRQRSGNFGGLKFPNP